MVTGLDYCVLWRRKCQAIRVLCWLPLMDLSFILFEVSGTIEVRQFYS